MAHLWVWFVSAVWPNLVASMIWGTPAGVLFLLHHLHLKRHHANELRKVREQHTEDLRKLRVHLLGAIADERQRQGGDR